MTKKRWVFFFISLFVSSIVFEALRIKSFAQEASFMAERKAHKTVLSKRGPAPQDWEEQKTPKGVRAVTYTSGGLQLKGWLTMPPKIAKGSKVPVVVYFHGGFSFSVEELQVCKPFLDAGFAIFTPSLRGENDNPGVFELFYGEIEDARAAILWLSRQPQINAKRIYTFGHSVGGGISALLSLWGDVPIRFGGSSGGLYPEKIFDEWRDIAPFDLRDEKEKKLRLLIGNMAYMKRGHIAFIGRSDTLLEVVPTAQTEAKKTKERLVIKIVDGDHITSLTPAIEEFVVLIKADQ
jgi:acetyl esterase/lipase